MIMVYPGREQFLQQMVEDSEKSVRHARRWLNVVLTLFVVVVLVALVIALVLAAKARADVFNMCPSHRVGVVAGTPTSCPFADNVRAAWLSQPGNPVVAYSPVTGLFYSMYCSKSNITVSGLNIDGWQCSGGNAAEVVVW